MFAGRLAAGAVVAAIVGVVAVGDPGKTARASLGCQARVELVLAEVTAVGRVRPILGAVDLGGRDEGVAQSELGNDAKGQLPVAVGIAGTVGGDGQRAIAENAAGRHGQKGTVYAAAERDDDRTELAEPRLETFGLERG